MHICISMMKKGPYTNIIKEYKKRKKSVEKNIGKSINRTGLNIWKTIHTKYCTFPSP